MPEPKQKLYCTKCKRTMAESQFYKHKDGTYDSYCKACISLHINNFEPDTFMWVLERFDVPYIESEWNVIRDREYLKDPYKFNGMSVIGRYLAKMRLKNYAHYTWADTEKLAEEAKEREEEHKSQLSTDAEMAIQAKEAYERGEISEAQYKTFMDSAAVADLAASSVNPTTAAPAQSSSIAAAPSPQPQYMNQVSSPQAPGGFIADPATMMNSVTPPIDLGADLTEDDRIYLSMKWGQLYTPSEWVSLEKLYTDFMNSFEIQGAGRLDTLKKVCKTSLKMDQAIDAGDVESFTKLSRVYDALMKSARFTEAQNKAQDEDCVNSVGEIVIFCEREKGMIPEFDLSVNRDVIDVVIKDLKGYTRSLIYEDKSLAQEIELYLKNKEILEERKLEKLAQIAAGKDPNDPDELTDDEMADFREEQEQTREENDKIFYGEEENK